MSIIGADISGWQPTNVNLNGLVFVYVKATEGVYKVNANHDAQVAEARTLGLIVGHYHFPAWGDPAAEAQAFVAASGWVPGEFMVLDIENSDQTPWPADPVSWCCAFERAVYRLIGLWCLDYAGPNVRAAWNWAPLAALGGGLISPEYNPVGPGNPAPWASVAMWQNADTNQTGGDSDVFYGDRAALTAYGTPSMAAAGGTVTIIPEGPFMALTDAQQQDLYNRIKYLDAPVSAVPAKAAGAVWSTPVHRGTADVPALQELADTKTGIINARTTLAALAGAPAGTVTLTDAQVANLATTLKAELPAATLAALTAQLTK